MMKKAVQERQCLDVIQDLDEAMRDVLSPAQTYFVLGGIATAVINDPESTFDHQTEQLVAGPNSSESTMRDRGSRRDIDVFVLDVIPRERRKQISVKIGEAIGNELVPSVFSLKEHKETDNPVWRGASSISSWTCDRTIDQDGVIRLELFPLSQEIPKKVFEPWTLVLPSGKSFSILNPAAHMLAYKTRSISSERHKDREKLSRMEKRVIADPVFAEQIYEGDLASLQRLADDIKMLNDGLDLEYLARVYQIPVNYLRIARLKGRLLGVLESNEVIINYAQRGLVQTLTKPFTGAT